MTAYGPIFSSRNLISDVSELDGDISPSDSNKVSDSAMRKLFDRNIDVKMVTAGFNYPPTTGPFTVTWTPSSTKTVNIIAIQNHNADTIIIDYNGTGLPVWGSVGPGNTETNSLLLLSAQNVDSVEISFVDTMNSGEAFQIGQIYIGEIIYTIDDSMAGNLNLPDAKQKSSIIELSDGTIDNIFTKSNLHWNLLLKHATAAERLSLKTVYDYHKRSPFFFIPRPDTASWDGIGHHMIWANGPDFERFSGGSAADGYDAIIRMLQAGGR